MVVEELLELLVDIVDADLFKAIVVEDLEAGDVEDTDIGDLLHRRVAWKSGLKTDYSRIHKYINSRSEFRTVNCKENRE